MSSKSFVGLSFIKKVLEEMSPDEKIEVSESAQKFLLVIVDNFCKDLLEKAIENSNSRGSMYLEDEDLLFVLDVFYNIYLPGSKKRQNKREKGRGERNEESSARKDYLAKVEELHKKLNEGSN